MIKTHQEELKKLHHKLDSHTDTSLNHFRQTAMVRSKLYHSTNTEHPTEECSTQTSVFNDAIMFMRYLFTVNQKSGLLLFNWDCFRL